MPVALSILLPTFNGARFIEAQLHSILDQSFTDFELLVSDDGSSDGTVETIRKFAAADGRIRLLDARGGNKGQRSRLLFLLDAAKGPVIGFSDQDDVWSETKIERLMDHLGEAALAFGPSSLIDSDGRDLARTLHDVAQLPVQPSNRLQSLCMPLVSAHAMVMRRDAIATTAFRSSVPFDWAMTLDAQFSRGVTFVPEAVTWHRIHGGNQNNGHLANSLEPRSAFSEVWLPRWAYRKGNLDRMLFLKRLSYLATSEIVPHDARHLFTHLTYVAEDAWLVRTSPRARRLDAPCYTALREGLRPFAQDADWAAMDEILRILASSWRPRRMSRYIR